MSPISVTRTTRMPNQMGSMFICCTRGKKIGTVSSTMAMESMKQPSAIRMSRMPIITISAGAFSAAMESAMTKGTRLTARKYPNIMAPTMIRKPMPVDLTAASMQAATNCRFGIFV